MGNKKIVRIVAMLICIMTVAVMMPSAAMAAGDIDMSRNITLTVNYTHQGTPIPGAGFNLYKVADTDYNLNLTKTKDFAKYPFGLTDVSDEEWTTMALTLSGYVKRDGLTPLFTGKTDSKGLLKFPNTSSALSPGLYLVDGSPVKVDGYVYKAKPSMVFLPAFNEETNTWEYDITMKPKYERTEGEKTVTVKVLKIWNDKGNESKRPFEITVELLRDGQVFDTVKLNESNGWRYTWEGLSAKYEWTVVEKETTGYTVKVDKQGNTYTITNTYVPPNNPPNNPPEKPPAKPPEVPYTGLLWWPVPILVICGAVLAGVGLIRKKKKSDEKQR